MNKISAAILLALTLCLSACTDKEHSLKALTAMGFTDVSFTGHAFAQCSRDDHCSTGFIAKNPQGQIVEGVVCCDVLKNCTVRL